MLGVTTMHQEPSLHEDIAAPTQSEHSKLHLIAASFCLQIPSQPKLEKKQLFGGSIRGPSEVDTGFVRGRYGVHPEPTFLKFFRPPPPWRGPTVVAD